MWEIPSVVYLCNILPTHELFAHNMAFDGYPVFRFMFRLFYYKLLMSLPANIVLLFTHLQSYIILVSFFFWTRLL